MKIQELTVIDACSLRPSVRLRIAATHDIDENAVHLVAFVTIDREGVAFENIELCALDEILGLVASAKAAVNAASDAVRNLPPK